MAAKKKPFDPKSLLAKPTAEQKKIKRTLAAFHSRFDAAQEKRKVDTAGGWGDQLAQYSTTPTGILSFDYFFGGWTGWTFGGFINGVFTIYAGRNGTCKTSLMLKAMYNMIKNGKMPFYGLLEAALSGEWLRLQFSDYLDHWYKENDELQHFEGLVEDETNLGLFRYEIYQDLDACLDHLLELAALETTHDASFIDTITGIIARKQAQDSKGNQRAISDETVGVRAKLLTDFFGRMAHKVRLHNNPYILVSQMRKNLDSQTSKYQPDSVPGGTAAEHNSRCTIFVRRGAPVKEGKNKIGFELVWKVEKAQVGLGIAEGNTFRTVFFTDPDHPVMGFDPVYEVINVATHCGVLSKKNNSNMVYTDSQGVEHTIGGSLSSLATTVLKNVRSADPVAIPGPGKDPEITYKALWKDMEDEIRVRLVAENKRREKLEEDLPPFVEFPNRFGGETVLYGDEQEEDQLTDQEEQLAVPSAA